MPFVESYLEFKGRMGCAAIYTGKRYLFSNGGQSDGTDRGTASHRDPPADEYSLLALRVEFARAELESWQAKEKKHYDFVARQLEYFQWGSGPAPTDADIDELGRLQDRIAVLRGKLATVEKKLARTRAAQKKLADSQWREELAEQRKEKAASIRQRLQELDV